MGKSTGYRGLNRRMVRSEASRLIAIRAIVDVAGNEEYHDVVAEALLVLGASEQEITAAMLDSTV
jgi:hypothetical protein